MCQNLFLFDILNHRGRHLAIMPCRRLAHGRAQGFRDHRVAGVFTYSSTFAVLLAAVAGVAVNWIFVIALVLQALCLLGFCMICMRDKRPAADRDEQRKVV